MAGNERYMPQGYAAKMRAARRERAMRGERRIITILFCDVVGSTAMAGQLDPEEWAEIMNEAFEYLITPIYRYEGTVARLMGDAILAFFGAPIAHEDDPTRAILAALAIVEGIKGFAAEIQEDYGLEFNVRVGINTGPVVVGEIGTDLALEYTAMGDAINLASRMETTADPGKVQITADTYRLVAHLFDVEDVGPIGVKGKEEPVPAYSVLSLKAQPGKLRGIAGLEVPLIGRGRALNRLIEAVNNMKVGQGQIIYLTGEAGLGKSRLLDELRVHFTDDIAAERIGWTGGRGISYDAARPYGVIMQMFRQISGVSLNDPLHVAREKIRAQITSFRSGPREPMTRALEVLLAIEDSSEEPGPEGEALQRELFAAFLETWKQTTHNIPVIAVNEDIQWADPASTELLIHLFQLVDKTPSLFICTFRPQPDSPAQRLQEAATGYEDYFTPIALHPLSLPEGAKMVESLVSTAELPPELRDKILTRAGGNPFFIEEVVRSLVERGALVRENKELHWRSDEDVTQIEIPNNVLSLLVSRIDRLDLETKRVVQLAAVIGRSFYRRVLEQIVDPALDLVEHLGKLAEMDLIEQETGAQEATYLFRQAMVRDAAYQSLLHRQRRRTHRRVAEVMEALFVGRLDDEAHQLAYHFYEARRFEKALHYFTIAGDQAARLYAHEEAIEQYRRALEIGQDSGTDEKVRYLYLARGRMFELGGRYEEALADYRALQSWALDRDSKRVQLEGLLAETTLLSTYTDQFDPQQGRARLEEALILAEAVDDRRAQAKIYWNLMLQGTYGHHRPAEIVAYGEKAVAIAREGDYKEELAFALHDLARPYSQVGKMDQAAFVLVEAGELWRELGNKPMLADNLATLASGYRYLGRLEEGLALANEALEISQAIGNDWGVAYSSNVMGPIYMDLGRIDEALATWKRSIPAAMKANFIGALAFVRIDWGLAYGYIGQTEKGLALVTEAYEKVLAMQQSQLASYPLLAQATLHLFAGDRAAAAALFEELAAGAEMLRLNIITANLFNAVEAQVGMNEGRYGEVLQNLDQAIVHAQGMGMVIWLIELWLIKGEALARLGRMEEARALLEQARREAERTGARKYLWSILQSLAEIAELGGEGEKANDLLETMQAEIRFVAGQIGDKGMKRAFLETANN